MFGSLIFAALIGQLPSSPLKLSGAFDVHAKQATVDLKSKKATILFFIAVDCPIANRYAPEIRRIAQEYGKKGVQSYRVYVLDSTHAKEVSAHGKEFKFDFPALLDPNRKLVKETGVTVTPEVAVISSAGREVYRGRIDNQNVEHGVIRQVYRRDLRVALSEYLSGKPVSVPVTSATGCFL